MSAAAHTNIDEASIASMPLNTEPAVTSISVSARIEYIQRFSKQAVLIVDNDSGVYSQAARQFLISLAKDKPSKANNSAQETNVAFVSASSKLNDIQMRCRFIEQLFANTLFDPEKSLAVSLLTLSKESKENITIVVEHAHALSLQMKYELCQLVDVANKTQSKINVALFGNEQAAQNVAKNKSIFKKKLAIIDAKSGQLFPLDHAKFTSDNVMFSNKLWLKIATAALVIFGLIGLSWFVLINYNNFSLSQLPEVTTNDNVIIANSKQSEDQPLAQGNKAIALTEADELATTVDIQAALMGEQQAIVIRESRSAQTGDILQALDLAEVKKSAVTIEKLTPVTGQNAANKAAVAKVKPELVTKEAVSKPTEVTLPLALTPNYYLSSPSGYVVQLVGFTDLTLLKRFMKTHTNLQYFSYQKKLNDQTFIVLTTKIFENKAQASEAISSLPKSIIDRGVWVKDLALVKAEINNR
jgi:DamX protein